MFKNLAKNIFTYSFGAILFRCITSAITFIAIATLTTAEYGLLSLVNTFIGIVPIFFNLGLRQAFWLDYFHTDNAGRKRIINDIVCIYLIIATPIFLLFLSQVNLINKNIFINQANITLIYVALFISFLHFFIELFFQVLRYQENAKKLVITQITMASINCISAFVLLYVLDYKLEGIIFANLISILCLYFYAFYLYFKKIKFINFNILKNKQKIFYYLKLGLPFIPSIIFSWVLSFADRWILAHYKNLDATGIYSLADSFAQMFQAIILVPIISSYQPYILKQFAKNKDIKNIERQNIKNMFFTMLILATATISGFMLCKNLLYLIFPTKFHEAINYILILILGQIFFLGSQFATCFLVYNKKTYILMFIMIIAASLNLLLNYLLIPKYSLYGCSFATMLAYCVYLLLILIANKILLVKSF